MSQAKVCRFCKEEKEPDYKDTSSFRGLISEHGRIYSRIRTGTCAKHQRRLAVAIKRARHLAFLPFIAEV